MACAKTHVRALQAARRPRQTESASMYRHSARAHGIHLGNRTGNATTSRESVGAKLWLCNVSVAEWTTVGEPLGQL